MPEEDEFTRLAIVDSKRCKPQQCRQECRRYCPPQNNEKRCIAITKEQAAISEVICTGCAICVQRCPYHAITIIRLPKNIDKLTSHRYGRNMFKLHRLPTPRPGRVLGLLGANGIGKSTALQILSGQIRPNLGRYQDPPSWREVLDYYRGSELQNFLRRIVDEEITSSLKLQYVEALGRMEAFAKMRVGKVLLDTYDRPDDDPLKLKDLVRRLDLGGLVSRRIPELSGGELQRFALAVAAAKRVTLYLIDEPSSYLDVRQRLAASNVVRDLAAGDNYVICVEHDLAVLDNLSDYICILFGEPGVYGVVSLPYTVRAGINIYLSGYIPSENMRFRPDPLSFRMVENANDDEAAGDEGAAVVNYRYPAMSKTFVEKTKDGEKPVFHLDVEAGQFSTSQIVVLLGENGTGKTTLIRMLAGQLMPDGGEEVLADFPQIEVSYKPQKIKVTSEKTVMAHLLERIPRMANNPLFKAEVLDKLNIDLTGEHTRFNRHNISDQVVINLSGGERQRVAIAQVLGTPADVYLLDEPSAYLDVEQRVVVAKLIRRWIMTTRKSGFVVEHDFLMASYLADRIIIYEGEPGVRATARAPDSLLSGFNNFLRSIGVTFRRDPTNFRPRINKLGSAKDVAQKASGNYFFLDTADGKDDDDDEIDE